LSESGGQKPRFRGSGYGPWIVTLPCLRRPLREAFGRPPVRGRSPTHRGPTTFAVRGAPGPAPPTWTAGLACGGPGPEAVPGGDAGAGGLLLRRAGAVQCGASR